MVPASILTLSLVTAISGVEACAQSLSYLAYSKSSSLYFVASWIMYLVIVFLLWKSYHYKGVGYINVLWSGLTTAFMLLIGYFVFGERLSREEWVGAVFILVGILIMIFHNVWNHLRQIGG